MTFSEAQSVMLRAHINISPDIPRGYAVSTTEGQLQSIRCKRKRRDNGRRPGPTPTAGRVGRELQQSSLSTICKASAVRLLQVSQEQQSRQQGRVLACT